MAIATFVFMPQKKTILVAPLHWGIGHATRCIPVIRALLENNFEVILASDGNALLLLRKTFPTLEFVELPSYHIRYSKTKNFLKWKLLFQLPKILKAISKERRIVAKLVAAGKIQGIISDNRFGVHHPAIPTAYITHQLNVVSGSTTRLSTFLHQRIIKKFDVCWVPDTEDARFNLSGKLGHLDRQPFPIKYMGVLSSLEKSVVAKSIDILVLLSGPEPQRTLLENLLKSELKFCDKNIVLVRGVIEEGQKWEKFHQINIVNFVTGATLSDFLNKSELVISRPGYSTIMDLALLEKRAFFIPTPGQFEQEYLAKRMKDLWMAPFCSQKNFTLKKLENVAAYKGLNALSAEPVDFPHLFSLFQSKGKL